jgi:MFS family permease
MTSDGRNTEQLSQLKSLFTDRRVHQFFLFGAVNNFAFPILSSFVPTKGQLLGLTPWHISVVIAAEAVAYTISSYFAGRLSDRLGRRPFVFWAQPLVILACLGLAWSRDWPGLALFYALFGLGSSMTFLMSSVMMADITPPEQCATVLGAFDAAIDMVLFVAPALALALYGPLKTIEPLFVLASVPAWLALYVAWRLRETRPLAVVS